ncbi:hypothetical protein [Candidatus Magnetobacterium casense]|uniref:Uncharacterized protein n=1 Tax=Candidatus Magnetobacterium casense TaxID=1455061 RepID=A0ABS6S5G3_9BACT|nr:hypothetical protein [Candidatus Magnetobacterium casensis]MBV6343733.1 hypothetical protein [Candidatus Magnetobacterium casensis]
MNQAFAVESAIDHHLQERTIQGSYTTSMRDLTDTARVSRALPLPQPAGTRVRFTANIGSVLSYDDIPEHNGEGTIITVRTGAGDTTHLDGRVFVLWDDGKFRSILAEHLRPALSKKFAKGLRIVVSDLGDLSQFFSKSTSGRQDELIHKSTEDLRALKKDGDQYIVERLFTDTGKPLKV